MISIFGWLSNGNIPISFLCIVEIDFCFVHNLTEVQLYGNNMMVMGYNDRNRISRRMNILRISQNSLCIMHNSIINRSSTLLLQNYCKIIFLIAPIFKEEYNLRERQSFGCKGNNRLQLFRINPQIVVDLIPCIIPMYTFCLLANTQRFFI